jgi:hypothetical protein
MVSTRSFTEDNQTFLIWDNRTRTLARHQAWWYVPVIPALRRQKQEDSKFKTSLGYKTKPYLQKIQKKKKTLARAYLYSQSVQVVPYFPRIGEACTHNLHYNKKLNTLWAQNCLQPVTLMCGDGQWPLSFKSLNPWRKSSVFRARP